MGLLKKAQNNTAYVKAGIMGFAGSGKTRTATEIAIGLAKNAGVKQIAFFDTEKGSDFIEKLCAANGIELLVHKGRSFQDLLTIFKEVQEAKIQVLIIDSISHVWRDLCDSYARKFNKKSLTMYDWGILKGQWKMYTDAYINSPIHVMMLGRAGYEYEQQENEDTHKKEMIRSGTKMKVEGETGFEPDILIEMERIETKTGIINRAWVIKDRSDTMNGKSYDMPKYETFRPFLDFLNIGGEHKGIDTDRDSADMFDDKDWSYEERKKRKEIAIESIQEALILAGLDGRSSEVQKQRTEKLIKCLGTSTSTGINNLKVQELESGLLLLKKDLGLIKEESPLPKISSDIMPEDALAKEHAEAVKEMEKAQ